MKKLTYLERRTKARKEAGQAILFTVLALGIFLVGAMAFAIDLSNTWFNRQSAQTAADAACTAGVMDMLVQATDGNMPTSAHFTMGTAFDCFGAGPTPSPCSYAALNGFTSSISQSSANSGTLGTNVYVDFPTASSVNLSSLNFPSSSVASSALMRVKISSNNPTWFGSLLGTKKQGNGASATCAVINSTSPIPILVLNPTKSASLLMNGGGSVSGTGCANPPCGDIVIAGGPSKSIQVNSSSPTAINFNGGPTIDLCAGGGNYCGSNLGVWGAVLNPGTTNFWTTSAVCRSQNTGQTPPLCSGTQNPPQWQNSPPIADPLAMSQSPGVPTLTPPANGTFVLYHVSGCPQSTGCQLFTPGYYSNGIKVQSETAIFQPGVYYLAGSPSGCNGGSLCEDSNSCIRPSTDQGDGSGGTIFYFSDTNSILVKSNGGGCNPPGGATIDPFPILTSPTSTSTSYLTNGVKCTSASTIPQNLSAVGSLNGSVLLAPCKAPTVTSQCGSANNPSGNANCSLNFGDPLGTSDPNGEQRGTLFFQNRSVNATNNPSWSGGGSMLLAGTMYFHQCVTAAPDTGVGCTGSVWNDQLTLGGNSGSSTYVLGDIIVDQLHVGGSGQIVMDLNPSAAFTTLKAALVQ